MASNIFPKLAIAIAGSVLSFAAIEAHPAHAAIITYDFNVDVTRGSLAGNTYNGFFSYDDTSFPPARSPSTIQPYFDVSEFNFNFAGRTYNVGDLRFDCRPSSGSACFPLVITGGQVVTKLDTPPFTFLTPRGGTLTSFNFMNVGFMGFPTSTSQPLFQIEDFLKTSFFAYELPGESANFNSGSVTYSLRQPSTSVPEPSADFGLSGLGILGLGWLLKKKIASSQRA